MKKVIAVIAIVVLVVIAWHTGRLNGVQHAVRDSVVWTVDRYDPDAPEASAWGEYDQLIYIEVDGKLYQHGMYQG